MRSSRRCTVEDFPHRFAKLRMAAGDNPVGRLLPVMMVLSGLIAGCGGGSSTSTTTQVTPPSNLVYAQTTINASVEVPLTPDTPTVTGTVSSFTVAPTLPVGMTLNPTTGVVSGTPTSVAAKANYTVTASNAGGSTVTVLQISVAVSAPSNLVYPQTTINATTGVGIQPDIPSVTGQVISYSVSPALPAGLSLDTTTGSITGIPTAPAAQATYVVTASNSVGSTTASLQVTVSLAAPTNLVYPQPVINASTGTAIQADIPSVTGLVSSYTVSPGLPAGLLLNAATGAIMGTPTTASAQASYTVTASNAAGSTTATLQITVTQSGPTNLVYPQTTINAIVGTAIAQDLPTFNGPVTRFSVVPDLPAGLALNSSSGAINGTPTAAAATTAYTVTATNAAGSTTATLQITVTLTPPSNLVYPQTVISATVGLAIVVDSPKVTGLFTEYSISPPLPAGLSFDQSSGTIAGTPTETSPRTVYTVSAQNGGGSTTAQLTITVGAAPVVLFQSGHRSAIKSLHSSADRLLSSDADGHWILWDYFSTDIVAQGDGSPQTDLEGQVFVVNGTAGLEVRSAQDGSFLFTVPPGTTITSIPADGSYVCTASSTGLTVWSPTGSAEAVRTGDYSRARIFAAAGQVQIADGAAGMNVIETIVVPTGTSTVSATFSGAFQFWFGDGSKFLTQFGNVYWVYSNAGAQVAVATLPSGVAQWQGGVGNQIWSANSAYILEVFTIAATTPTQTFQLPVGSSYGPEGDIVVAYDEPSNLTIVDLSGAVPTMTQYSLPNTEIFATAITGNPNGHWAVGNKYGVVMDATNLPTSPRYFGYGQVRGVAVGGNVAAIATASGRILLYDLTVPRQTGTIDFLAGYMSLSSDGTVLAAQGDSLDNQYQTDWTLNIYSLPSMAAIQSFPYTFGVTGEPFLIDFSLSGSGTTLGQTTETYGDHYPASRQVTGITGTPLIWSDSGIRGPTELSPDGSLIAVPNGDDSNQSIYASFLIYKNGLPVAYVNSALPIGWIDNDHLLVATIQLVDHGSVYTNGSIYDATGVLVSNLPAYTLPVIQKPQFPTSNTVYSYLTNTIYSLSTGAVIWQGPYPRSPDPTGAVNGNEVIYYDYSTGQVLVVPVG